MDCAFQTLYNYRHLYDRTGFFLMGQIVFQMLHQLFEMFSYFLSARVPFSHGICQDDVSRPVFYIAALFHRHSQFSSLQVLNNNPFNLLALVLMAYVILQLFQNIPITTHW
eukprot:NODE_17_length_41373_cov_0.337016.p29 type:complete len:111 gc:universal NODE_17_length_41373_cov_0.337016:19717-19385(-)